MSSSCSRSLSIVTHDRSRPGGGLVRTLTLARPERRNALDPEHLRALADAVTQAGFDDAVRVLVVTGQGTSFCAGYDLGVPLTPDEGAAPDALVMQAMALVRACPLPVLARVNGPTFGAGLELAISCDLRIASEQASFCLPPAKLGIAYAPEGLSRLVSLTGTAAARRLAFTGEVITAARAGVIGLVDEVTPPDELDDRVASLADALADTAPLAVRAMKRTFNGLESRLPPDARRAAEQDRLACYTSADAAEGLRAFAEKRSPLFRKR